MRRLIAAALGSITLALPVGSAAASLRTTTAKRTAPKKKVVVVTKTIKGPEAQVSRWGLLRVTLILKKTTTTAGTKKTVKRRITKVSVPESPNHTDRSVFINEQALPILVQEVLRAQFNPNIDLVSGATDSSYAFGESLQAAILQAKRA